MCSTSQSNHAASSSCGARSARAAVGRHRAVAVRRDRDDDAGAAADRPDDLDTSLDELARHELTRRVAAAFADEASLGAELATPRPRRSRPARRRRSGSSPPGRHPGRAGRQLDDHVEQQVAERGQPHEYDRRMDGTSRGGRIRSFAIGGLVGAAGAAVAAVRRSPARAGPRDAPGGLVAFEDAPCFLELLGEQAQRYREGGETSTGSSNPT